MSEAMHWPFPGQEHLPPPVYDLPPPRFAVGDRVRSRWGDAKVLKVLPWPVIAGRGYLLRHGWSTAPEGFGHTHGESELEPIGQAECAPIIKAPAAPQLELFS